MTICMSVEEIRAAVAAYIQNIIGKQVETKDVAFSATVTAQVTFKPQDTTAAPPPFNVADLLPGNTVYSIPKKVFLQEIPIKGSGITWGNVGSSCENGCQED